MGNCDKILEALDTARAAQKCDLKTGRGMAGGGAGGAIYVLQQGDGYLPIKATISASTFSGDKSEHDDKQLRAEIVVVNCGSLALSGLAMTVIAPTLYKLSLRKVTMTSASGFGPGITCAQGLLVSTDPQIVITASTCR